MTRTINLNFLYASHRNGKSVFVKWSVCFLLLFIASIANSQEFSYSHYTARDGLGSSVVYCMQQDVDGFMWFGTETGVSRFDGTQFKTFTTADGLPDNAILRMFADSHGRIWMMPFKNAICYYYKGKIYNQENDSTLRKIDLTDFAMGCVETRSKEIVIVDKKNIFSITADNRVLTYPCARAPDCYLSKISYGEDNDFLLLDEQKVFATKDFNHYEYLYNLHPKQMGEGQALMSRSLVCWITGMNVLHVNSYLHKIEYDVTIPALNSLWKVSETLLGLNTTRGTIIFDILKRAPVEHFLSNKNVSTCFTDNEGGTWFSTINDGVYRLHSRKVKNFKTLGTGDQTFHVFTLLQDGKSILLGTDMGCLQLDMDSTGQAVSIRKKYSVPIEKPIRSVIIRGETRILSSGSNVFVSEAGSPMRSTAQFGAIKQMDFLGEHKLILGTSAALMILEYPSLICRKVLYDSRVTSLLVRNDSVYFGTLSGLRLLKPDGKVMDLSDSIPFLRGKRIAAIGEGANGTIWVAGNCGLVEIRNNRMLRAFGAMNGLSSDDCRTIAVDHNCIWVGTDKGLDRVFTDQSGSIIKYSKADGLGSNVINSLLVSGNYVYAGTPEGVSFFDKQTMATSSRCDLRLLNVTIDGVPAQQAASYSLPYNKRNIRLDYVGISYGSEGDIEYTYRLDGLDTGWHKTRQTSLDFIALPAGDYRLDLIATNKFGVVSKLMQLSLCIEAPFWQRGWFILLAALLLIGITWLLVAERSKRQRKKERSALAIQEKLQELEQKALRAQMNPHFIFNSLNSIQGFILDSDADSANKYLSSFARLIRQTLDNSIHPEISVEDEINYLGTYLQLEQLRFKHSFKYSVKADPEVNVSKTFIPGMVLQPFVENAIRHGIQHRGGGGGEVQVQFFRMQEWLWCTVTDNGPGREIVQSIKSSQHIEYQSRGMQLTTERISVLNMQQRKPIAVEVEDMKDEYGNIAGTRITVKFPVIQ